MFFFFFNFYLSGAVLPGSAGRPSDSARENRDTGGLGFKNAEEKTRAQIDGSSMGLQRFVSHRRRIRSITVVLPARLRSVVRSKTEEPFALQRFQVRRFRRRAERRINYTGLSFVSFFPSTPQRQPSESAIIISYLNDIRNFFAGN